VTDDTDFLDRVGTDTRPGVWLCRKCLIEGGSLDHAATRSYQVPAAPCPLSPGCGDLVMTCICQQPDPKIAAAMRRDGISESTISRSQPICMLDKEGCPYRQG
jgi:hypothetical protein